MKEMLEKRKLESESKLQGFSKQMSEHQTALSQLQQLFLQEQGRYSEINQLLELSIY